MTPAMRQYSGTSLTAGTTAATEMIVSGSFDLERLSQLEALNGDAERIAAQKKTRVEFRMALLEAITVI